MNSTEYDLCVKILPVEITFSEWLTNELKIRELTPSQLARKAGLARGTISNIINGNRGVGEETLTALARAFQIPPETIFRAAGLLPPQPSTMIFDVSYLAYMLQDNGLIEEWFEYGHYLLNRKKK